MVSMKALSIFLLFAILALAQATVHHHVIENTDGSTNRGHDGNLFDDAASVLDNFFG